MGIGGDAGRRPDRRGGPALGHGVGLTDMLLGFMFYVLTGLGVTVRLRRCFTHRAFKAKPALRTALALAGSMSFEGAPISWVATHRRHHAFSDRPGDPHSPYRYGADPAARPRGLLFPHLSWLFGNDPTSWEHYAPDLLVERPMTRASRAFPLLFAASLALPALAGLAIGGTWYAAFTALIWAGLVRVDLLRHVTWSVNSLCHVLGTLPFTTRRHHRAANLWPLALISFGESWHNMHHSDPTCARHGVDRLQLDPSARVIRMFEQLGWASDVRWADPARLATRRNATARPSTGAETPPEHDDPMDMRHVRVGCEFVHVAAIDTPAVVQETGDRDRLEPPPRPAAFQQMTPQLRKLAGFLDPNKWARMQLPRAS